MGSIKVKPVKAGVEMKITLDGARLPSEVLSKEAPTAKELDYARKGFVEGKLGNRSMDDFIKDLTSIK